MSSSTSISGASGFRPQQLSAEQLNQLRARFEKSGGPQQAEKQLDSALQSSGLSADQQTSLKSDLESVLKSAFDSSGSSPPDPSKIEQSVKDVFSKYGLDATKFQGKFGPPGGGFPPGGPGGFGGGPPGAGGVGGSSKDSELQTLLKSLSNYKSDNDDDDSSSSTNKSSSSQSQIVSQLAEYLTKAGIGFDTKA